MIEILVVDDHPAFCYALKAILSFNVSFHVSTASDGNIALGCLKKKQGI